MRTLHICRAAALGILVLLAACSTVDPKRDTVKRTEAMKKGPETAPTRNVTNFSAALRCMDTTFITYGIRDVSVLVEDIKDETKKVNAGTKDMLISAVSDMTKRSRAVRLVAYGSDSGNLVSFLQQAERKNVYQLIPKFDIKGSVSQLDESLIKRQTDAGIGWGNNFSLGAAASAASNVLGIDLTMLTTDNLSIIPGVTSRNSVVIYKEGQGLEADATIKKFGMNFGLSLSKAEGQSQALRTLVELAAIELLGKLTRTPYWTCLGVGAENDLVKNEVSDWFAVLMSDPPQMVSWLQEQMRARRYYYGPVNGTVNDQLREALTKYRSALGLETNAKIDLAFFSAYLNADHAKVLAKNPPPPPPQPVAEVPDAARALRLATTNPTLPFKAGELINLTVKPSRDTYLYCYWQDETNKITRFFPNRFTADALIKAENTFEIPGKMRYQLFANEKHLPEKVACFGADRDVLSALPGNVKGTDFEPLQISSLDQVREALVVANGGRIVTEVFDVKVQ